MSEEKETKVETTETPEKAEKPEKPKKAKTPKKSTKTTEAPKEKKKKTLKKKKTTKKVVEGAVKDKKKTVKSAIKKADETKKKTKKTTTKPTKKTVTEKKVKTKKAAAPKKEKTEKKEKTVEFSKFESMIGEALFALETEDKPYVSFKRIKEYLLKYMDGLVGMIPRMTRKTIDKLTEKKYLKKKKDSYAFAKLGNDKLRPDKIPKRKEIERPVKEKPKEVEAPPPKEIITLAGRTSRQVIRD